MGETVRQGLEMALADGSFDQLFYQVHGKLIEQVEFSKRVVIELQNAAMPKETPLDRAALWYRQGDIEAYRKRHPESP